jgi:rSAM/selenodomain-associated transferase 2
MLSLVIPTLNEAPIIEAFLRHLAEIVPGAERIVADGGSEDGTAERAAALARVVRAPRGRARQMNAGAAAARGEALWFLHADSRLPEGAAPALQAALADPGLAGGCFRIRLPRRGLAYRIADDLGNRAVDLFRTALGDHGIFARRAAFEALGGYPDVPLMEDAEFYRALAAHGRVRQLPLAIETSPRRWERHGPARTTALYALILALYLARVPLPLLAHLHRRAFRTVG